MCVKQSDNVIDVRQIGVTALERTREGSQK